MITKTDGENIKKAKVAKSNYQNALHLFPSSKNNWTPPVLTCSSLENRGIDKVFEMINSFETHNIENGWLQNNRQKQRFFWFKEKLDSLIKADFYKNNQINDQIKSLNQDIESGKIDPFNAAKQLFSSNDS